MHYPVPMHMQPAYATLGAYPAMPVSERLAERVISLPMDAYLPEADQRTVVEQLGRALEKVARQAA